DRAISSNRASPGGIRRLWRSSWPASVSSSRIASDAARRCSSMSLASLSMALLSAEPARCEAVSRSVCGRHDLDEVDEHLRGLLEAAARVELELPVEVVPTGEEVRRWQAPEGQLCPVRAAADGGDDRRQAGSLGRLDRVLDEVRVILQDVLDVPVEVLDLDADPDVRKKRLRF